jgi:peptidoglycan-N-acetylmuramic acid deacetylase
MNKNSINLIISLILLVLVIGGCDYRQTTVQKETKSDSLSATLSNRTLSWYVVRQKDHLLPQPNTEGGFPLAKYGAYYLGKNEKVIYLTFDEGYENGHTPAILDILKKQKVPAAFFVTKPYIDSNPELIKRMVKEGHIVANHSKTHPSMPSKTNNEAAFRIEIEDTAKAFSALTGKEMPTYFRPPRGEFSEKSLDMTQKLGYHTIFWSFAYEDWLTDKQPASDEALCKILDNTHNGEIMLLHAVSSTNTAILEQAIKEIRKQGYRFAPLSSLPS